MHFKLHSLLQDGLDLFLQGVAQGGDVVGELFVFEGEGEFALFEGVEGREEGGAEGGEVFFGFFDLGVGVGGLGGCYL